jgi:type IV pilus assembly protein PilQ
MAGETTVVRVVGDGEFDYSTFSLENPARFVIDLNDVVNASSRSAVPVESDAVQQVRMAQFRPYPDAVARVVFDLSDGASPVVERAADGLTVRFGPPPAGMEAQAAVAETPPPFEEEADLGVEPVQVAQVQEETAVEMELEAPLPPLEQEEALPEEEVAPAIQPPPRRAQAETPSPTSDVRLFESQEVPPITPPESTSTVVAPFGVRRMSGETEWVGEPISMSLKDADITEVLRSIARISNLNIVIQPGVSGPVTVELDRVPWDQALDQILKINNLGMQLEGNILRIAPSAQLRAEAQEQQLLQQARALSVPLRTVLKRVSYANAQDVASILTSGVGQDDRFGGLPTGIMSQRGTVSVDQRTNTLIIKELPDFLDAVIQIIENLDVPEKQVMIEARIVETTRSFDRTLGIDWSFAGVSSAATGNTTGLEFPNNGNVVGGVQLLTGGQNGFLNIGLGNVLNTFELDLTLSAAESDGLVNIISTPKVATLNNETAFIQSGLQIPIQTVANNTVTVQFVNATLRLEVTPQVTADGTILMDINIQKREPQLAFAVAGATNAPIATREARTRVIVRDGGTTVIGGIYEVSNDQGEDRVPGLANVPILGKLFRNRRRATDNEELLIFITPRVIQL